jgi:hypothetical protein
MYYDQVKTIYIQYFHRNKEESISTLYCCQDMEDHQVSVIVVKEESKSFNAINPMEDHQVNVMVVNEESKFSNAATNPRYVLNRPFD